MATRYWVGGTGNWDASDTTHWSATSGGASGASVPTSADDVVFDSASNATAYTLTAAATANCLSLTMGAPASGKITWAGTAALNIYGSLNLSGGTAGITRTYNGDITFSATTTGETVTTNGVTLFAVEFGGVGGGWTLQDDYSGGTTGSMVLFNGTLDANNKNVTLDATNFYGGTLHMGSGTWTLKSGWEISGTLTINANTSTIKYTNTSNAAVYFIGGGKTYNNVWFSRGASTGSITVWGSNTFNDFKDDGSAAHSILFAAGTTQTVTSFTVSGTAGNLKTINSTTTATHALTKSGGGTISCDYLNIQHSVASPGTTWYAGANSTDNQSVATAGSGWIFTAPPSGPSVSDTPTISESVTATTSDGITSVSDTMTTAESVTASHSEKAVSVSDALSISESTSASMISGVVWDVDVFDVLTISEFVGYYPDTAHVVEFLSIRVVGPDLSVSVNDVLSISELAAAANAAGYASVVDSKSITENISVDNLVAPGAPIDTLAISEDTAVRVTVSVSTNDSISISEYTAADKFLSIIVNETISPAESVSTFSHRFSVSEAPKGYGLAGSGIVNVPTYGYSS